MLDRLVAGSLYTYNFKGGDPAVRTMGAMTQDFHATFGLGDGSTAIASGNLDGVAPAAIHGLDERLEERVAELRQARRERDAEIAALRSRLEARGDRGVSPSCSMRNLIASTGSAGPNS